MYLVGKIIGTHGINGEIKVINESDFNRFFVGNILYIKNNEKYEKITIDSVREHKNFLLVGFNNHKNINDVIKYVNLNIYTDKHELLENGKYYYDDLINCDILDMADNFIGKVNDIIQMPKGELLEIKEKNNKIVLVPFVKEFIKKVDLENKKIIIQPIEGLL